MSEIKLLREYYDKKFLMQEHKITELEIKFRSVILQFDELKKAYYSHVNMEIGNYD